MHANHASKAVYKKKTRSATFSDKCGAVLLSPHFRSSNTPKCYYNYNFSKAIAFETGEDAYASRGHAMKRFAGL